MGLLSDRHVRNEAAKLPKIYAFLKPVDNKSVPMTTSDMVSESNSALINSDMAVAIDVATEQNNTLESTVPDQILINN